MPDPDMGGTIMHIVGAYSHAEALWRELLGHHLQGAPHLAALGPARAPEDSWRVRILGACGARSTCGGWLHLGPRRCSRRVLAALQATPWSGSSRQPARGGGGTRSAFRRPS